MRALPRTSHQSCTPGLTTDTATGETGGEAKADSLITLTGDVPNLIWLSTTTEVADAVDAFPGTMADKLPGVMLQEAVDTTTGALPDTTATELSMADELPGVMLRDAADTTTDVLPDTTADELSTADELPGCDAARCS